MKHMEKKKSLLHLFVPRRVVALEYERDRRIEKTKECILLKEENQKLWEISVKQRLALDALQQGHEKDMEEMSSALKKAHEKIARVEAERERYKNALRRAFPKEASS